MKTVSVGIENLCVPCRANCRYCLLSSVGRAAGVSYDRGKAFARRFLAELKEKRPDLRGYYYIGYCMDTPELTDYIRFCRETGSPSADFLQLNGLSFREEGETAALMEAVAAEGVRAADLTFYGLREYHDRFAGREGDFRWLLRLARAAKGAGLAVTASVPVTMENAGETGALLGLLEEQADTVRFFLPHGKGRGRALEGARLTRGAFEAFPEPVRRRFPAAPVKTEGEWLAENTWPEGERRSLTLCLTPENVEELEGMRAEELVAMLEELDDRCYAQVPDLKELAARYGDPAGERLFRLRDLHLFWQRRYLEEHPGIYDVNDETHHFSVRV